MKYKANRINWQQLSEKKLRNVINSISNRFGCYCVWLCLRFFLRWTKHQNLWLKSAQLNWKSVLCMCMWNMFDFFSPPKVIIVLISKPNARGCYSRSRWFPNMISLHEITGFLLCLLLFLVIKHRAKNEKSHQSFWAINRTGCLIDAEAAGYVFICMCLFWFIAIFIVIHSLNGCPAPSWISPL